MLVPVSFLDPFHHTIDGGGLAPHTLQVTSDIFPATKVGPETLSTLTDTIPTVGGGEGRGRN